MKPSLVSVFKGGVAVLFIGLVAVCAFRSYPHSETLTIVRNEPEQTTVTSAFTSSPQSSHPTYPTQSVTVSQPEPQEITTVSVEPPDIPTVSESLDSMPPSESTADRLEIRQTVPKDIVSEPQTEHETRLININTASAAQLKTLSGIGDAKAQAIIDYRTLHGNFTSIDDLTKVNGIGEKTLEKIRDYITID